MAVCGSVMEIAGKVPRNSGGRDLNTDENALRSSILRLYSLSSVLNSFKNKISQSAKDESQISENFMEILSGKTTEEAIFIKKKSEIDENFKELLRVDGEIKAVKSEILKKCSEMGRGNNSLSQEDSAYFNYLLNIIDDFMSKYKKIKKGEDFYKGKETYVNDLINKSNNWMIYRNNEKNEMNKMLKSMNKGKYLGTY